VPFVLECIAYASGVHKRQYYNKTLRLNNLGLMSNTPPVWECRVL
jgi:hypothetical protein